MRENNIIFKLSPFILSVITIIAVIGSVFSNYAITKMQIAEIQEQLLEVKTNVKVLEAQSEVRNLAVIVQRMDLNLVKVETILQQWEKRFENVEKDIDMLRQGVLGK